MGFFDALRRVLSHEKHGHLSEETKQRIRDAWGLNEEELPSEPEAEETGQASAGREVLASTASAYDRSQWQRRLRRIFDELPDSHAEWNDLMADAHALKLEPTWIRDRQQEEFAFMIRRAVADRVVTESEHQRLDLARTLIGITEAEAEDRLHSIMAEAEAFFGAPVKEES